MKSDTPIGALFAKAVKEPLPENDSQQGKINSNKAQCHVSQDCPASVGSKQPVQLQPQALDTSSLGAAQSMSKEVTLDAWQRSQVTGAACASPSVQANNPFSTTAQKHNASISHAAGDGEDDEDGPLYGFETLVSGDHGPRKRTRKEEGRLSQPGVHNASADTVIDLSQDHDDLDEAPTPGMQPALRPPTKKARGYTRDHDPPAQRAQHTANANAFPYPEVLGTLSQVGCTNNSKARSVACVKLLDGRADDGPHMLDRHQTLLDCMTRTDGACFAQILLSIVAMFMHHKSLYSCSMQLCIRSVPSWVAMATPHIAMLLKAAMRLCMCIEVVRSYLCDHLLACLPVSLPWQAGVLSTVVEGTVDLTGPMGLLHELTHTRPAASGAQVNMHASWASHAPLCTNAKPAKCGA